MSTGFVIPYALRGEEIVHINDVGRGRLADCVCPRCRVPVWAKKGNCNTHHFSHPPGCECTAETVLHWLGVRFIAQALSNAIAKGANMHLFWQCRDCKGWHTITNLLQNGATVGVEMPIGEYKPDVVLLTNENHPTIFFEVVVSHTTDRQKREFCRANRIGLIEFHMRKGTQLEDIRNGTWLAKSRVYMCPHPTCKVCGKTKRPRELWIRKTFCRGCKLQVPFAWRVVEGDVVGLAGITLHEVQVARKYGVVVSKRDREFYVRNDRTLLQERVCTCPTCNTVLFDWQPSYRRQCHAWVSTGWHCLHCQPLTPAHYKLAVAHRDRPPPTFPAPPPRCPVRLPYATAPAGTSQSDKLPLTASGSLPFSPRVL